MRTRSERSGLRVAAAPAPRPGRTAASGAWNGEDGRSGQLHGPPPGHVTMPSRSSVRAIGRAEETEAPTRFNRASTAGSRAHRGQVGATGSAYPPDRAEDVARRRPIPMASTTSGPAVISRDSRRPSPTARPLGRTAPCRRARGGGAVGCRGRGRPARARPRAGSDPTVGSGHGACVGQSDTGEIRRPERSGRGREGWIGQWTATRRTACR